MSAVFVMVSLEGATCSGMAAEQYVFSRVRRRSSKWRGVVMCVKKKTGCSWNFRDSEGISDEISEEVKVCRPCEFCLRKKC